eukprot:s4126_g3.t1
MPSASLHPSAAFAVSQQDAMAFGSEEATMGSWRKSVADLQVPISRTYEWITGRMSTTRKHLLVVAFMVLEGVKYLLAREAFVPGVNNLSILVVENLVSLVAPPAVEPMPFPTARQNAKICFLGLDNAGKTTLLQMLRDGRLGVNAPTLYPNQEELCIQGIRFRTFDLGGHETARRIWKDFDPALARVPFAVLGNKIDIPVAASEDELRHALGLYTHMTSGKHVMGGKKDGVDWEYFAVRPIELFMCSVVKRMGYTEAFDWLAKLV